MIIHQNDPYKVGEIRVLKKPNESKVCTNLSPRQRPPSLSTPPDTPGHTHHPTNPSLHIYIYIYAKITQAKDLLQKVALQVQPLMRTHKFTVPLLTEFSPKQPNLLGLNVGGGNGKSLEIRIRLRPPSSSSSISQDSFYPYEHILGTMLHELIHNVRGPHDALFYKKLDELTAECEELMAKGIIGSGQGFDAPSAGRIGGKRLLGTTTTTNTNKNSSIRGIGDRTNNGFEQQQQQLGQPAKHILREAMMKAAEARARQASVMPTGPRKVGGNPILKNIMTAREAAVYAAERRLRDNVWCPTEEEGGVCIEEEEERGGGNGGVDVALQRVLDGGAGSKREKKKNDKKRNSGRGTGEKEEEKEVVVLIDSDDDRQRQVGESSKRKRSLEDNDDGWTCMICTLVNKQLVLQCMACLTERPPHV